LLFPNPSTGIPLGIYLAFTHHLGLHGLWFGLTFSLVYCSLIGTWLVLSTDWQHEVDKVRERLRREDKARMREVVDEERMGGGNREE
jgi:MATE family multidrug resistance protein